MPHLIAHKPTPDRCVDGGFQLFLSWKTGRDAPMGSGPITTGGRLPPTAPQLPQPYHTAPSGAQAVVKDHGGGQLYTFVSDYDPYARVSFVRARHVRVFA